MRIKRTIRTWSDKFKDLFFKSTNRFQISNIIIELIPLNNSEWKKRVLEVSCLTLNKWMLLWFLVVRVNITLGIISKRQEFKISPYSIRNLGKEGLKLAPTQTFVYNT